MSSLNEVNLIGRLGQDPDYKQLQNGGVANLTLATSKKWRDKNTGEQKEHTEWHRIVVYGKLADICSQYLHKGSLIYIKGELRTRKWQDQSGQDRYTTEIQAGDMQILSNPQGQNQGGQGQAASGNRPANNNQPARNSAPQSNQTPMGFDDDIPF